MAVILMLVFLAGGVSMSQGKLYKLFYYKKSSLKNVSYVLS